MTPATFLALFLIVCSVIAIYFILGMFDFWKWFANELGKPARYRTELEDEFGKSIIQNYCEVRQVERARQLQEWDHEYLALLSRGIPIENPPVGKQFLVEQEWSDAVSRLNLQQLAQPNEIETDFEFLQFQKESRSYNARKHSGYY